MLQSQKLQYFLFGGGNYNNKMGSDCNVLASRLCMPTQPVINPHIHFTNRIDSINSYRKKVNGLLVNKYQFQAFQFNVYFGRCSKVKSRENHKFYFLKQLQWQEYAFQQLYKLKLKHKLFSDHNELIQIVDFQLVQEPPQGRILLVLQVPTQSLKKVFYQRRTEAKCFTKNEIVNILISSVQGFARVEESGSRNDKVRMETIFFEEFSGQTKVVDNSIIISSSNYGVMKKKGYFSRESETVYLSPEQFIGYLHFKDQPVINQKSGVFALGATILALCLMMPVNGIYNIEQKFINTSLLNSFIYIAGNKYGSFVMKVLLLMLQFDENKRPSFISLWNIIEKQREKLFKQIYQSGRSQVLSPKTEISSQYRPVLEGLKVCKDDLSQFQRTMTKQNTVYWKVQELSQLKSESSQNIPLKLNFNQQSNGSGSSYYEGQMRGGQPHGWGILYFKNSIKKVYGCQCDNNSINESISSINSIQLQKYEGNFINGEPWGEGRLYYSNGTIIQGQFINGKLIEQNNQLYQHILARRWSLQQPATIYSENYTTFPTDFSLNI